MAEQIITGITLADLQQLESEHDLYTIEISNGRVQKVERNMTWLHTYIMRELLLLLLQYVRERDMGTVMPDGARYTLEATDDTITRSYVPDLSFVKKGRITADFDWNKHFMGAPDFAVEIASPGQSTQTLIAHILHYLEAGAEEAWLILPSRQEIHQYRHEEGYPRSYRIGETIATPLFHELGLLVDTLFDVKP